MKSLASDKGSLLGYFGVLILLSIPFWLVGALIPVRLLPGLPVSALEVLCPVGAAAILVYRLGGWTGVAGLMGRSFDFHRVKHPLWYAPALLLMPVIMVLSFVTMRLLGVPIPMPTFSVLTTVVLFLVFFISALAEELGWSGYAIDPLQSRFGALGGALVLGAAWAVWHFSPLLSVPRSLEWIAWWSLGTVATRVITTWLYNNTGRSVFVAALFHTTVNLTWQLFPIHGSFFDPRVTSLITVAVAIVVVIISGPRKLVRT